MNLSSVRFTEADNPEFYRVLQKRVNQYFKEKKLSRHANLNMWLKTFFMLTLYFAPFVLLVSGMASSIWAVLLLYFVMGLGLAGIGLTIMHDANHGAYSADQRINNFMGFTLNYLGGFHTNWKIQHNVLHHSFTNIDGYDEDIEKKGIIRFSPTQKHRSGFRFQAFYAPFLYAILTLYWVTVKDFDQFSNYHKRGLLKGQNLSYRSALTRIVLFKLAYYAVIFGLPMFLTGISWWIILAGFLIMHAVGGMILALVFQSAHVLSETHFCTTDDSNGVENSWAIHQMKTTSNFAMRNVPLTWLIGGLNHQIEHHLFPGVCHVHYPALSKIVKATANEFDVPYLEHRTFIGAIANHFVFLHKLGAKAA